MGGNQTRLDLQIDIFEKKSQRALALSTLTPPELIEAILQEFHELEYLGNTPTNYQLLKAGDRTPLENDSPLGHQGLNGGKLILVENDMSLPKDTQRPTQHVYLREQTAGKVYKLHWQPAIIGRSDKNQPHNDWVAVNLDTHESGLRVSRRHAQITEANGQYFVESLSRNPTAIKGKDGNTRPVAEEKVPLHPGDTILLERSNIALKFIVRPEKTTTENTTKPE